jgi:hypothetical protein
VTPKKKREQTMSERPERHALGDTCVGFKPADV